ncbi:MAG: DUF262 domain-containing protein [Bacteroidales bacterium]|nr:DUF262 domain-containing protein [Bacteroidales bacterium]
MNDVYSFYKLINNYQIEIPIIQRDYAQGRRNVRAADVRKSIVHSMIEAVKGEKELFFDFVYGRIIGNKFIPFDGQQRLTTLFLFHKYIFERSKKSSICQNNERFHYKDILKRFSYTTRQSSKEFCEKIVEENVIPLQGELSENVKNQSWFFPDWEKDPTIMGMLTMLDEIHNQLKRDFDFNDFAEKLTNKCSCPITFLFVDMGEHQLTDETYVKMNARGKTLTPFENFKASLEQFLEERKEPGLLARLKGTYDEISKMHTGVDGIWMELFWDIVNPTNENNKEKKIARRNNDEFRQ